MPILDTDIKLMASERMHDEDDGGGRMSGNEIIDGQSNNMFPDVSQLDRTYGRLNLRKAFEAILSDNVDTFFGSHIIISKPPSDDTIHATLFKTSTSDSAWVDERSDAQNKIESYITVGQISPMVLLGTHYEGQRALLTYQRQSSATPSVGDVYALVDNTNNHTQFVRVTGVTIEEAVYTDSSGDFVRDEITLDISDPLAYQFEGGTAHRESDYQPETSLNKTNSIPAVSYFGIQPLAETAAFGEREVKAESYKGYLLPATQSEEPILDVNLSNSSEYIDESIAGGRNVLISQIQETTYTEIQGGNRGYNYVFQLNPKPAKKTLQISYRAQEKWYKINDTTGDGQLQGDGSGSVNYATGSVSVTLADMPDVGTRIICGWGSGDYLERHDSDATPDPPEYRYTVQNPPIEPGSITITWNTGSKSVTDDGAGNLTGDGSGYVLYSIGYIAFYPDIMPEPSEIPQLSYTKREKTTEIFTDVIADPGTGLKTLTLANQPEPHSIKVTYSAHRWKKCVNKYHWCYFKEGCNRLNYELTTPNFISFIAHDDGVNKLNIGDHSAVDFAAKTITIDCGIDYDWKLKWYEESYCVATPEYVCYPRKKHWEYGSTETTPISSGMTVTVEYCISGASTQVYNEDIPAQNLEIDLTSTTEKRIYPGSISFNMAGHTYWDYEGVIYRDGNYVVADAIVSGSVNYDSGVVILTDWVSGSSTVDVTSLLVEINPWVATDFTSYTALAPIRPGSLTIAVTATNGDLLTASTDVTGTISGAGIRGIVDVDTGIIDVEFGDMVDDSSLSDEEKAMDWYDPNDVVGGQIWYPRTVYPTTARYNCVAYVYLPLSSDILGIDPVRLPMDGRVPVFRVGDVIVIHNTQETSISSPTNGQVVDTGRERLAWAILYDANDDLVDTSKYTVNLDAGTVILDDVSGLSTPLLLKDRIEDMALVNDLQIDGTLGITKALSHDYTINDTYISSSLITSDLFARVTNIFEQETWTGVWSDELIGNAPLAAFNDTAYPITITNIGGTQERWMARFTSSTVFEVYGEFSGLVATGNTSTDCSPLNPATNEPYFTIPYLGWGTGWNIGNLVRFNTVAANRPIWIARTVLQSDAYSGTDNFCIEIRGDVDTP